MPQIFRGIEQASEEWFNLRLGIPTASEFSRFMDADFNLKQPRSKEAKANGELNESVFTYACEKLAERERGPMLDYQSEARFSTFAIDQGKHSEKLARKWLAMELEEEIEEVAFVKTDDGRAGCSPDGLLCDDAGLELKCPQAVNHVKYLLEGVLPPEYVAQVHGSLYVTGRKHWHFLSYNETITTEAFHLVIERDEQIMARIGKSLDSFCYILDTLHAKLKAIQ